MDIKQAVGEYCLPVQHKILVERVVTAQFFEVISIIKPRRKVLEVIRQEIIESIGIKKLDGTMKKLEEFLKRRCICQKMKD